MIVGFANKEEIGKGASWHATCSSVRKTHLICVFLSKLTPWRCLELSPSAFPLSASKPSPVSSENAENISVCISWPDFPWLFRLLFLMIKVSSAQMSEHYCVQMEEAGEQSVNRQDLESHTPTERG